MAAHAQTLKGIIVDSKTGNPLSSVFITNMANLQSVYSDENGLFSIDGKAGEIIIFSIIGYKTIKLPMPPVLGTQRQKIQMQQLSYQLREFVFHSKFTQYQLDSAERRSTYKLELETPRASVMSPASFIAERFSKKSKQRWKFQKDFRQWESERFVSTRYTTELVHKLTGLNGDTLAYFVNIYPMPADFARAASDMELKVWIRYNFKDWQQHPVYPPFVYGKDSTGSKE
jgi:hypothetical protein